MFNYTNPAFCQQSEFYPRTNANNSNKATETLAKTQRSESMRSISRNARNNQPTQFELRSFRQQRIQQRELPPKPGPKPIQFNINAKVRAPTKCETKNSTNDAYALVPLDELPSTSKGRYAILGSQEANMIRGSSMRLTKSQDDLDRISDSTPEFAYEEEEDSFTSLPAFTPQEDNNRKLISAFSTDFINKSMILLDQSNMQRYAIVPTDDDEEIVDSSHEIIQMHNGRAHRYAVIPTDEDETCLSGEFETNSIVRNYQSIKQTNSVPIGFATPPKTKPSATTQTHKFNANVFNTPNKHSQPKLHQPTNNSKPQHQNVQRNESARKIPETPTKNPIATQKLHELLSTPRKKPITNQTQLQRHGSYQTIIHRSPNRYQSQILYTTHKQSEFTPQKLQYDVRKVHAQQKFADQRTTAIISPRLQQSIYNETTLSDGTDKSWPHESYQKVENATATIAIISLMLILTGVLNSGLCMYMISDVSDKNTVSNIPRIQIYYKLYFIVIFRCVDHIFWTWESFLDLQQQLLV